MFEDASAEGTGGSLVKKMAGYHQFHAVNTAVEETLRAASLAPPRRIGETPGVYESGSRPGGAAGDRRVGVIWHTQGSGKSLTMAFYAGRVDVFAAAGLKKPDISILSDEFLAEVRGMPQRNLAVELLQKLLRGEIRLRGRSNVVQARSFADLLDQAVRRYQNRAIETAQVIEALIGLAREMRAAHARGESLGLTDDELAFYDALETNDSAVKVLGDDALRAIAWELVETVRRNASIDWTIRDNVRAQRSSWCW